MNEPLPLPKLAALLKEEIVKSPYEVRQVFKMANIPAPYLARWKREDVRPPSYIEIARLANILGKPVEYFIFGELYDFQVKYDEFLKEVQDLADQKRKEANGL